LYTPTATAQEGLLFVRAQDLVGGHSGGHRSCSSGHETRKCNHHRDKRGCTASQVTIALVASPNERDRYIARRYGSDDDVNGEDAPFDAMRWLSHDAGCGRLHTQTKSRRVGENMQNQRVDKGGKTLVSPINKGDADACYPEGKLEAYERGSGMTYAGGR
jgi:hypothetical protein